MRLASFRPIELNDMDHVKLLQRTDTKFSFPVDHLPLILEKLQPHYQALSIKGTRICRYQTLYFDTDNLQLYLNHHNKRSSRFKIRHRSYLESNKGFMELKHKNARNETVKSRIRQDLVSDILSGEARRLILEKSNVDPDLLKTSLLVNYSRITLVGKAERLTIDMIIEFSANGKHSALPGIAIAEIKQSRAGRSPALAIFKQEKLRPCTISKYCLGIIATHPGIKQNNFKQKIKAILK